MNRIQTKKQWKKVYKDTWSMDWSFTHWLEPRLKCYLKEGGRVIDLTIDSYKINGEEKTHEEWVKEMISLCEQLNNRDTWVDDDRPNKLQRLGTIWTELLPVMWW